MPIEKSCGAVIFRRDGRGILYLLLLYPGGHWDFVKGNVEEGEDEKDTVLREMKEEAGITDAKFIDDFRDVIKYFYRKGKALIRKEVVFYLVETGQKEIKLSFEHDDFRWAGFNEALGMVTFKNAKEILKKANSMLSKKKDLKDF